MRGTSFDVLGVDATVTRPQPDDVPIATRVIWLTAATEGFTEMQRREARRVMALRRDDVPTAPLGTLVLAPDPEGGPIRRWRVDGFERFDTATIRVTVVAFPEPTD